MSLLTLNPGTRLGPYEILSALGAGGMGEVYRATDTNLKRQVAIKVLPQTVAGDPECLARFQREAELLAALNHPNIAAIYGLEKTDGTIALVMELVEGPTLADRIAQGAIPIADALPIARQIAEALEAAHEQGIVHRDLKPANIKVRSDGAVKVLDFGLARAMDPTSSSIANATMSPTLSMHATQAGIILGTAAYMSPEQAAGKPVDKRSDLWAFGVVLLEMLTGSQVFKGETVSHVLAAVLKDEPDWTTLPPNTPASLRRLLRRCLEKDRKQRLDSAADARLEIQDALTGPAVETTPTVAPRRVSTLPIAVALAGSALVVALAMWVLMRSTAEQRPLTRFSVDLGPDAVAGRDLTVAISPDGRRIVFPIRGANGTPQLATRLLDQATPTPLPGTENGGDPFFSPDGQWIAFAADRKLNKISVLGGAAVTVCDAPGFRGGSWGEDGTIVAALGNSTVTGLFSIPAAGGTPQPLTKLVNGDRTHRWPQILPGGQSVLFTASTTDSQFEEATVQVLSVKTGQVTPVVHGGYFGRYLAGQLTYVHQGVLFGVPFDVARLAVRGTPVPLLDDVASDPTTAGGQLDVSQTGTVVYRSGKAAAQRYPVVWLDRSGKTEPLLSKPGVYRSPRLSPDGQRLAIFLDSDRGRNLWVYDHARDIMTQLTFDGMSGGAVSWTPDGKRLAYSTFGPTWRIQAIRADGAGEPQPLLESKIAIVPSSFSPDGRRLLYFEIDPKTFQDLWTLPLDVSDPEHPKPGKPESFLRTPSLEYEPAFSPDGRWIAYKSGQRGRAIEVFVRPFPGPGGQWQVSNGGGSEPVWSRNGKELFYLTPDGHIMVVDYAVKGDSFGAGKPRLWTDTRTWHLDGQWNMDLAPDGKRFVVFPLPETTAEDQGPVHVTFLLNFFDELHRRLP